MRRMIWFARKRRIEINSMRYLRGCERFPMSHRKTRIEIEERLRASDTLEARMRASSGEYVLLSGARPATSAEIAEHMEQRSALAKYWVGDDAIYLWLITHDGFHSFVIPATLEQTRLLVASWVENLEARSEQKPGEGLAERASRIARADA